MTENDIWTIRAALEWTEGYLERKGDANPRLSTQWLLSTATGLSRIQLYADFDKPLSMEERAVLREYVSRRGRGEPLQYISGETGFRHITLKVREGVLIPRPETEVLVSEVLACLTAPERPRSAEFLAEISADLDEGDTEKVTEDLQNDQDILIADLCTGSGCIACSLAYEHPNVRVVATDISSEAVKLAQENVRQLGLEEKIQILECDLGSAIETDLLGTFDVVVSNPPYVPSAVMKSIPSEVSSFEPPLALDGGVDGLDVYRCIVKWARLALKPGGVLAVELHETCLDDAAVIAEEDGFCDTRIVKDLAGKPRILIARLNGES